MPEEVKTEEAVAEKPKEASKKPPEKTVPLSALIQERQKRQETKQELEEKLADLEAKLRRETSEKKLSKIDFDNEESVDNVKSYLIELDETLTAKEQTISKREAQAVERERKATAKELVLRLKEKGVEATADELLAEENMDLAAATMIGDHLAGKIAGLEKSPKEEEATPKPEETTFESQNVGAKQVSVTGMSDAEFEKYWEKQKQEATLKLYK